MKLQDYKGELLEDYTYVFNEDNRVDFMKFYEYRGGHNIRTVEFSRNGKSDMYRRVDTGISTPVIVSIQPDLYLREVKNVSELSGFFKYTYDTVDEKNKREDIFLIEVPTKDPNKYRKIEVDRNSVAYYHPDLSLIQVYLCGKDGSANFDMGHDIIYVYDSHMVMEYEAEYKNRIVLNDSKEEYINCCRSGIALEYPEIILANTERYNVEYNQLGMVSGVIDTHGIYYSRYEAIDENTRYIHSIYPYLGGRPELHRFPFREVWVHDEANYEEGHLIFMTRHVYTIGEEHRLLTDLRSNLSEPIIEADVHLL